jgi:hypothetical protein
MEADLAKGNEGRHVTKPNMAAWCEYGDYISLIDGTNLCLERAMHCWLIQ